jgi:ketosteroid isomerase-like protein
MSEQNVELVRHAVEVVNRGEWDELVAMAAPGFEFDITRANGPVHGSYGLDEIRSLLVEFAGSWDSLRFEPGELIDAGDDVVVPWAMHARGRDGIEVVSRVTWVWTVREGAIARACMYQELEDALEAVGLPDR